MGLGRENTKQNASNVRTYSLNDVYIARKVTYPKISQNDRRQHKDLA